MITDIALGAGREFDLIREMSRRWGARAPGLGDDAAVVPPLPDGERLVVTIDSTIENRHFRREWLSAREVGYRAAAVAISDIAAMAARPVGMLVAIAAPNDWIADLPAIADGLGEASDHCGVPILGGDLSASAELVLCVTVLGSTANPISRRGILLDQAIYVTGRLGGPGAALAAWLEGKTPPPEARERFARPVPRLAEAERLVELGATALIDISDGLVGDVGHLAAASDLRIALELDRVLTLQGISPLDAARSGEEYELAAAAPADLDVDLFARETGVPLSRIGRVVAGPPGVELMLNGERVASAGGFSHF